MSAPVVIFDSAIEMPEIVHSLYMYPDEKSDTSMNPINQTKVDGIIMPLIRLNDMSINYQQIESFELKSVGFMPMLSITLRDDSGIMKTFNKTEADNLLQIQILPPFDNAYKKINMVFYVANHETHKGRLTFDCIYKLDGLRDSRLESFGEVTTFELFEDIAKKLGLGFVSNAQSTDDKRWIYCDNCSYQDKIISEMDCAGSKTSIFNAWIDFRNNLTLLDIYERFHSIDDNLYIWTKKSKVPDVSDDTGDLSKPIKVPAVISNHYTLRNTPLFVEKYETIMNNDAEIINGTDEVSICYSFDDCAEDNWYMMDGSIEKDTTTKYDYVGEYFGKFNYLAQRNAVRIFRNKINKSCISVELHSLCLGLMRGDKINLRWYEVGTMIGDRMNKINKETQTNIPMDEESSAGIETQVINNEVSGQYLIKDIIISYRSGSWSQKMTLVKVDGSIKIEQ